MQKFVLAVAICAVVVVFAVASSSANKLGLEDEFGHGLGGFRRGGGHLRRGGGGLRGGFGHGGGFGGHHLGGIEDELLFEELQRRGHRGLGGYRGGRGGLGGLGGFGGGHGGLGGGRLSRRGLKRSGGFGHGGGLGHGGLGGVGGVGAIGGGAGGFRDTEGALGGLEAGGQDFELGLAEKSQGGLLAGQKGFDVGQHLNAHNANEGLHKHQVINSDKTIIKDRTTGVNDVDSFRNSNGFSEGSHLGGGESGIAAGFDQGKILGGRESSSHLGALALGGERTEAAGIAGAAF